MQGFLFMLHVCSCSSLACVTLLILTGVRKNGRLEEECVIPIEASETTMASVYVAVLLF